MLLKTSAFGLGFQQLPRDLANVNAWKNMFDPYNQKNFLAQIQMLVSRGIQIYIETSVVWDVFQL